jgi:hypothetical protein
MILFADLKSFIFRNYGDINKFKLSWLQYCVILIRKLKVKSLIINTSTLVVFMINGKVFKIFKIFIRRYQMDPASPTIPVLPKSCID